MVRRMQAAGAIPRAKAKAEADQQDAENDSVRADPKDDGQSAGAGKHRDQNAEGDRGDAAQHQQPFMVDDLS